MSDRKLSHPAPPAPASDEDEVLSLPLPVPLALPASLPDSPCIGICSTLFDAVCQGCGRTDVEVSNWVFFSDEEKRAIWERITREGTAVRFVRGPRR